MQYIQAFLDTHREKKKGHMENMPFVFMQNEMRYLQYKTHQILS